MNMTDNPKTKYDVIVIGGGHAGVEAALAAARLNKSVLLLFLEKGTVSLMPCNPSIGGTAKGHLVREIDALGGEMGLAADKALLQIKILNSAKGPAVYSLRGQEDKREYRKIIFQTLLETNGLTLCEGEAAQILTKDGTVSGVALSDGRKFACEAAVLATGVYLKADLIIGEYVKSSGPSGFPPASKLSSALAALGVPIRRFKTGTPARIYRGSIDFSALEEQKGGASDRFSFMSPHATFREESCYLTYTNAETHRIIFENISRSPLYNGCISGVGPRYCPSIETKVMRFKDKERHQIFVEPEGRDSEEMYVQGMSTSLPPDVQERMYRTLPGFESCRFARYGYAIEYDCIDPLSLYPSLESKVVPGLFLAGQINGSSGYEEAAAQGLIAGINASRKLEGKPPVILGRDRAYIGVLIDDLVTKGTDEPYRMMTARAEYRIMLRQDNADMRLTELGHEIGTVDEKRYARLKQKKAIIAEIDKLSDKTVPKAIVDALFALIGAQSPATSLTYAELCRRPELEPSAIAEAFQFENEAMTAWITEKKYEGYIRKQSNAVAEQKRLENKLIPEEIDYENIKALRIEARQKLSEIRPLNLGQASRISGVSPADITVLIVYLSKYFK